MNDAVARCIKAFVEAGVAGINLEDQVIGQPGPKRVVARDVMIEKIAATSRIGAAGNATGVSVENCDDCACISILADANVSA